MGWLGRLFGKGSEEHLAALRRIRGKFALFRSLLDRQNRVLKEIGQLEVRSRRNLPVDASDVLALEEGVGALVEQMVELGGDSYAVLRERLAEIRTAMWADAAEHRQVSPDEFVIPYDRLGRERAPSVGNKNANLGEMRSRLGLPVPDGFAISAWGFHRFLEANGLRERVDELLREEDAGTARDRESVVARVRSLVRSSPVPDDLRSAISEAFDGLTARCRDRRFAMRSSAIDEDGTLSFAGQFVTLLNVRREELLDAYRRVLASTFTSTAVYLARGHGTEHFESPMGVGCLALVDAASSGVLYTRDPLHPDEPVMLVNAIRGLGSYLVDGILTPDVIHVSREDRSVRVVSVARESVQLVPDEDGGVVEASVPEGERDRPAVSDDQLRMLAGFALRVEEHFGGPQDIEWAVDRDGRLFLLQARPLRLVHRAAPAPAPPEVRSRVLAEGDVSVRGPARPVFHVRSPEDIHDVPDGAVVVPEPSPRLIAIMHRAVALVTRVGGAASHGDAGPRGGDPRRGRIDRASELESGARSRSTRPRGDLRRVAARRWIWSGEAELPSDGAARRPACCGAR